MVVASGRKDGPLRPPWSWPLEEGGPSTEDGVQLQRSPPALLLLTLESSCYCRCQVPSVGALRWSAHPAPPSAPGSQTALLPGSLASAQPAGGQRCIRATACVSAVLGRVTPLFWEGLTRFLARLLSDDSIPGTQSTLLTKAPICNPQVSVAPGGWACIPGSGTHGPFPWAAQRWGCPGTTHRPRVPRRPRTDLASASRWQGQSLHLERLKRLYSLFLNIQFDQLTYV